MNLHQIGVIVTAAADLARSVGSGIEAIDRSRRGSFALGVPMLLAVAAGIAIGVLATKPELRRQTREFLLRAQGGGAQAPANGASPTHASSGPAAPSPFTAHA